MLGIFVNHRFNYGGSKHGGAIELTKFGFGNF